jgi:WD40 repeat protein
MVRDIRDRAGALAGRVSDLAEISAFASGDEGYRWLAGEPWSGKTALMAEAALTLRDRVDVVAFFAEQRRADADSLRFLATVVPQLARLLDEEIPPPEHVHFLSLWQRAAERAESKERHLVLLVDGLDEDLRPRGQRSIAAHLPATAGSHAHVLVSSRLHHQLPADVPVGHPLRAAQPRAIAPFDGARELAALAAQEIDDLLHRRDGGLAVEVLGLLAAAAGPLTVHDLAAMSTLTTERAVLERQIRSLMTVAGARTFQAANRERPDGSTQYQFAHESLLAYARACEDVDVQDYRRRIHLWAHHWRDASWLTPAGGLYGVPRYLLDAYPYTLSDDPQRLSELATDVAWVAASLAVRGIDRTLTDLHRAAALAPWNEMVAVMLTAVTYQAVDLRPPAPVDQPGYILRQIWMQAAELSSGGMPAADRLADGLRLRLQALSGPNLVPVWTTRKTSRALSVELGRHDDFIRDMALMADGRLVVADNGHVLIWDPTCPGTAPIELGGYGSGVTEVILADGGVITVEADGRALVRDPAGPNANRSDFGEWRTPGGRCLIPLESTLPDGRVVRTELGFNRLLVYEPDPGYWRGREMDCAVSALAALPDGRVAIGMEDGSVRIWDAGTFNAWPVEIGRHDDQVSGIVVLPDGRIATGSYDGRIRLWNIDMQPSPHGVPGGQGKVPAAWITPSRHLITAARGTISISDWDTSGPHSTSEAYIGGSLQAMALLRDGRVALAGPGNKVQIWDPACDAIESDRDGRQQFVELGQHSGDYAMAVAEFPDGRVVSGGYEGSVLLWNSEHPGSRPTLLGCTNRRVLALAVLRDGRVVSSGTDGRVLAWDTARRSTDPLVIGQHGDRVRAMVAMPDGRVVTGGWDRGRVLIWDPSSPGSAPVELGRHNGHVLSIATLPRGLVATAGSDSWVYVWSPSAVGTPVLQLACPVTLIAAGQHRQTASDFLIGHHGGGFSLWSFTAE